MELVFRRLPGNEVEVWPGICPHEGALIAECNIQDKTVTCPWHGRRFPAVVLSATGRTEWQFLSVAVTHRGDHLEISQESQVERKTPAESIAASESR